MPYVEMSSEDLTIERADLWECCIPLPYVIRLGEVIYTTRDYVVLRLVDSNGVEGYAGGYSRHTPLYEAVGTLLRGARYKEITPTSIHRALTHAFSAGWAALSRAASLIDLGLWDISSRRFAQSLGSLLFPGSASDISVPDMAVVGYFSEHRDRDSIIEEAVSFANRGYEIIKLMWPSADTAASYGLLEGIASALPSGVRLGVDLHSSMNDREELDRWMRNCPEVDIDFIEDPFLGFNVREYVRAQGLGIRIATGEDAVTVSHYDALCEAGVRFLRVDATTVGGLSPLVGWIHSAGSDLTVLPHAWPWVHQSLLRSGVVEAIEVVSKDTRADPIWGLLNFDSSADVSFGRPSLSPGLGWDFDTRLVAGAAKRHMTFISKDGQFL